MELDWEYNLVNEISEGRFSAKEIENGVKNIERVVNLLTFNERRILIAYYGGRKLKELAKSYGVSPERIRQIKAKAIMKLKVEKRLREIFASDLVQEQNDLRERLERENEVLQSQIERCRELRIKINDILMGEYEEKIAVLVKPIEELHLSNRAYNCLKKARIHTIGDLVNRTEKQIKNLRNIGEKSYYEITEKLKEMKLELAG